MEFVIEHPEHGEVTVTGDMLPGDGIPGHIPEDEHKQRVTNASNYARRKAHEEAQSHLADPDELLDSDEFRQRALEAWGIGSGDGEGGEPDGETAQRLRQLERKLEATAEKLAKKDNVIQELRLERQRARVLEEAGNLGDNRRFIDPSDAWAQLQGRMTGDGHILDPETGDVALTDDGDPMTYRDAVRALAEAKPHLVTDGTRFGTGHGGADDEPGEPKDIHAKIAQAYEDGNPYEALRLKREYNDKVIQEKR